MFLLVPHPSLVAYANFTLYIIAILFFCLYIASTINTFALDSTAASLSYWMTPLIPFTFPLPKASFYGNQTGCKPVCMVWSHDQPVNNRTNRFAYKRQRFGRSSQTEPYRGNTRTESKQVYNAPPSSIIHSQRSTLRGRSLIGSPV